MWKAVRRVTAVLLLVTRQLVGQTADTVAKNPPVVTPIEAVASIGLILGAATLDRTVRDEAQAGRNSARNSVASIGNAFGNPVYMAPVLVAGWAIGKISGSAPVARASYRAAMSAVLASTITAGLKIVTGRARPYSSDSPSHFRFFSSIDASFPSGHTTLAMSVASSLAHSIKPRWPAVLLYSGVALTGFARINDNKHWLSDVVAGAAIGYLTGRDVTQRLNKLKPIVGPGTLGLNVSF